MVRSRSRSSATNPGYTGYPARIYYEMTAYGRGSQELKEKMVILEKWYSHLRAYLPILYRGRESEYLDQLLMEGDGNGGTIRVSLHDKLVDASKEIDLMEKKYQGQFEGLTCTEQETEFLRIMRGVFERLDSITAIAEIIDKISISEEVEV